MYEEVCIPQTLNKEYPQRNSTFYLSPYLDAKPELVFILFNVIHDLEIKLIRIVK